MEYKAWIFQTILFHRILYCKKLRYVFELKSSEPNNLKVGERLSRYCVMQQKNASSFLYGMNQRIAQLTLVVNDYNEAIAFYTNVLGFELIEDTPLSETKRWVVVRPNGGEGCSLLLAKAATEEQQKVVGFQTGGRVFLFLHTDNIERDMARLKANNVKVVRELSEEPFGKVAVFADLYGNLWDLIEPSPQPSPAKREREPGSV